MLAVTLTLPVAMPRTPAPMLSSSMPWNCVTNAMCTENSLAKLLFGNWQISANENVSMPHARISSAWRKRWRWCWCASSDFYYANSCVLFIFSSLEQYATFNLAASIDSNNVRDARVCVCDDCQVYSRIIMLFMVCVCSAVGFWSWKCSVDFIKAMFRCYFDKHRENLWRTK